MVGRHSFLPRARVLVYGDCGNIGDAVQTVAIARLLGVPTAGIWRDAPMPQELSDIPFVVNGWLGRGSPIADSNCLFAGVHLGYREPTYIRWIRQSRYPVGARDDYTRGLLASSGIASELVGCATLTLPRYRGPRHGRLSIDVEPEPGIEFATSIIPSMSWADQWSLAVHRLDELRRAEIVYTRRLHVVLPCLAFGTPVVFPLAAFEDLYDKSRLGLLHAIGFTYGEPVEMDVTAHAGRFMRFLADGLGRPIEPVDEPVMPVPIMPRPEEGAAQVERSLDTALVKARAKQAAPISVTRSPTVTALVFTKNGEARLPDCLASIRRSGFADDIVVCVDAETRDDSVEVARAFTPHVHLAPAGYPESAAKFGQAVALCEGDFVLRMDDDERLDGNWDRESFGLLVRFNDLTHFWIPRRWIVPPGDQFIASPPWSTDLGLRLFLNDPRLLSYPSRVHEHLHVGGRSLVLYDRWIDHHALALSTRAEREEKCRRYLALRPDHDISLFYLYEGTDARLLPVSAPPLSGVEAANGRRRRFHALAPYEPGAEVDFRAGGNAGAYTVHGWSEAEPWGTWTVDGDAELLLSLDAPIEGQATLVAVVQGFVGPGHPVCHAEVLCRGVVVGEWAFDRPGPVEKRVVIPAARISRDRSLHLTFRALNPMSPLELRESADSRRLGLGVTSLRVLAG